MYMYMYVYMYTYTYTYRHMHMYMYMYMYIYVYNCSIMTPVRVHLWQPCPSRLPEILTKTHIGSENLPGCM